MPSGAGIKVQGFVGSLLLPVSQQLKTAALDFPLSLHRLIKSTSLQKSLRSLMGVVSRSDLFSSPLESKVTPIICSAPLSTHGWDLRFLQNWKQLVV